MREMNVNSRDSAVPYYVTKMASRRIDVPKLILLAKVVICNIPITKKLGAIFLYGPDRRKVGRTTDEWTTSD